MGRDYMQDTINSMFALTFTSKVFILKRIATDARVEIQKAFKYVKMESGRELN